MAKQTIQAPEPSTTEAPVVETMPTTVAPETTDVPTTLPPETTLPPVLESTDPDVKGELIRELYSIPTIDYSARMAIEQLIHEPTEENQAMMLSLVDGIPTIDRGRLLTFRDDLVAYFATLSK